MEEEEKDLVWLPKNLCKKIKELEDTDKFILDYIEESKKDIQLNIEAFDEEILIYKGLMAKARQGFLEAKTEALETNYAIWDSFDKESKNIYDKSSKLKDSLGPLTQELEKINGLIDKVRTHRIDELMSTIEKFNSLYGQNKEVFEFLLNNFGKEDK
jgi:hypothetical protein